MARRGRKLIANPSKHYSKEQKIQHDLDYEMSCLSDCEIIILKSLPGLLKYSNKQLTPLEAPGCFGRWRECEKRDTCWTETGNDCWIFYMVNVLRRKKFNSRRQQK